MVIIITVLCVVALAAGLSAYIELRHQKKRRAKLDAESKDYGYQPTKTLDKNNPPRSR